MFADQPGEDSGTTAICRTVEPIADAQDIATVRERLLDWVGAAIEASIPEAKARMIRLESRQAVADARRARTRRDADRAGPDPANAGGEVDRARPA